MTEQQEFLDYLKNPTRTLLKKAVEEFHQAYRNSIQTVRAIDHYRNKNEYTVEIHSTRGTVMTESKEMLVFTIEKYLSNAFVDIRSHEWDYTGIEGLHKWTWLVKER